KAVNASAVKNKVSRFPGLHATSTASNGFNASCNHAVLDSTKTSADRSPSSKTGAESPLNGSPSYSPSTMVSKSQYPSPSSSRPVPSTRITSSAVEEKWLIPPSRNTCPDDLATTTTVESVSTVATSAKTITHHPRTRGHQPPPQPHKDQTPA